MLGKLQNHVTSLEKESAEGRERMQALDVELKLTGDDLYRTRTDHDGKRVEISRLSSVRGTLHQCEEEYAGAKSAHDSFMEQFAVKSADIKQQLKVMIIK